MIERKEYKDILNYLQKTSEITKWEQDKVLEIEKEAEKYEVQHGFRKMENHYK